MRIFSIAVLGLGLLIFLSVEDRAFAQGSSKRATIQTVLTARQEATISSSLANRIKELGFYNGDLFEKGDVLISFDCKVIDSRLKQAGAILKKAKARYMTQKKLREMKSSSNLEYVTAEADYEGARASFNEVKAQQSDCIFKAPYDGRVTERFVNPHETVKPGQSLLKIASMDKLQARLLVPSTWLGRIGSGTSLDIEVHETGARYKAKIIRVGGEVDAVSQSIELVAEMEKPHDELLPGMSGRAYFEEP